MPFPSLSNTPNASLISSSVSGGGKSLDRRDYKGNILIYVTFKTLPFVLKNGYKFYICKTYEV